MFHAPQDKRIYFNAHYGHGNNGAFEIALSGRTKAFVIASDGEGWEHVSIHVKSQLKKEWITRTPSWPEMCKIKDIFWDAEDCVVQYHPPKSDYINNHPHCLHLWRPVNKEIPRPHKNLVGI